MKRFQSLFTLVACLSLILLMDCGGGGDEPQKIDCSKSDLTVTFESTNPESCAVVNGSITATATGGKGPYTYALNAGSFNVNPVFTQLSGGDYVVRVKDKNGCVSETVEIELTIPGSDLDVSVSTETDTECVGNNGSVTVTATGGTTPYQYKLNNGAFGGSATFNSMAPGNYTVTVQDAAGCLFPKAVTVSRGNTGTSLQDDIMPIITTNCAITNCHNGSESPNFTSKSNVVSNAAEIKRLTQNGTMPKEGSLTAAEKALIACWVDDGAEDN